MRVVLVALFVGVLGTVAGSWLGREFFGRSFQVNIDIAEGLDTSIVSNGDLERPILLSVDEERFDFETPCVSRQLKRDASADDYFELSTRLPKDAVDEPFFVDQRIHSFFFRCNGLLYHLTFDELGRTSSVSIRQF